MLIVEGKVSEDGFTGGLRVVAEQLMDLATARAKFARELRLSCNGGSDAQRLFALLKPYISGGTTVTVIYQSEDARGELELGEGWKISLDDHLVTALREWLAPENVGIVWEPPPSAPTQRYSQQSSSSYAYSE